MTERESTSLYCETAKDALAKWDAGESLFTVEMGGLSPGYEQCIHIAAFEVIRDMQDEPFPKAGDDGAWKAWSAKADVALHRADKFPGMGMSGAQADAAKSLAAHFCKHGPRQAIENLKEQDPDTDRIIQVSRNWPQAKP